MCLDEITKNKPLPTGTIRAWKVFFKKGDHYLFEYQNYYGSPRRGVWMESTHTNISVLWDQVYPSGFHSFRTRKDARLWRGEDRCLRVCSVLIRDVHTIGIQRDSVVYVSHFMKIPITKKRRSNHATKRS